MSKLTSSKHTSKSIAVDSLRIRIPADQVEIIGDLNTDKAIIDISSGNIEEEFKKTAKRIELKGYSVYFQTENQTTADQEVKPFVVLLFSSKILKGQYFEGITLNNIKTVYDELMSMDVCRFSYDAFLKGECTDVDFKRDTEKRDFDRSLKTLVAFSRPHKRSDYGYHSFNRKDNKGIQFSNRKHSSPSNPYLKIYHKGVELIHKSNIFYDAYLRGHDVEHLVRAEITIKNKKHFRKYDIDDTTLYNVLSLPDEKKEEMFRDIISQHLEKRTIIERDMSDITPTDATILTLLRVGMSSGRSYPVLREMCVQSVEKQRSARNIRDKIDDLYQRFIKGSEIDEITLSDEKFYNEIGWTG